MLREDGELIVDFLYDEAYLGDGEYIALSKTTEDGTRLTVLDNHGNVVLQKILWMDYILIVDIIMALLAWKVV